LIKKIISLLQIGFSGKYVSVEFHITRPESGKAIVEYDVKIPF